MIRIVTDSTADLSAADCNMLGVHVVPLSVHFGQNSYLDGIEIQHEQFYEMLSDAQHLPTTSQPSPEQFIKEFENAKQAGDDVICVLLSSELSGTLQSAVIAKEEVDYDRIFIVDSQTTTLGLQLLVRYTAQAITKGMSTEEIVESLETVRKRVHVFAIVDTLKYLHKGGRLSKVSAIAGSLLGIKPVVTLRNGKVTLSDKARGLPGAYVAIFKQIQKAGGIDSTFPVFLGYTGHRHGVDPFVNYITHHLNQPEPFIRAIGPVVGTHTGPGAVGIAFFAQEEV